MTEEIKNRTKAFGIASWRVCQTLPLEFKDYKRQLIRCSSSVGANYRSVCRAKSTNDFINKLKIVEEELDESLFFIEVISELSDKEQEKWKNIYKEGNELLAIIVKSIATARKNRKIVNLPYGNKNTYNGRNDSKRRISGDPVLGRLCRFI